MVSARFAASVAAAFLVTTASRPDAQLVYRFDMGPAGSAVATGARLVTSSKAYTLASPYGWTNPADVTGEFDVGSLDPLQVFLPDVHEEDLLRDGVQSGQTFTFQARLPVDTFRCVVTLGRPGSAASPIAPVEDLEISANGNVVVSGAFARLARNKATFDDAWGGYKRHGFYVKSDPNGVVQVTFRGAGTDEFPLLGIEFQRAEVEPVAFDHASGLLVPGAGYAVLQPALDCLNGGDYAGARAELDAITTDDLARAWGYAWLAGWFTGSEEDVDTALLDTIEALLVGLPAGAAHDALLDDVRLFRAGELFVRTRAYSFTAFPENPDSVVGLIHNSCAGIQLLEQLHGDVLQASASSALPESPFHAKAAYLIARNMYGRNTNFFLENTFTGQDFRPYNTYELGLFDDLWTRLDPSAPGALYPDAHEQITLAWFLETFIPVGTVGPLDPWDGTSLPPIDFSATWWNAETEFGVLAGHNPPDWADYQRRWARTLRNAARWWAVYPQNRDGEIGGGLGDDSEAAALIVPNITRTEWSENVVESGWQDILDNHLYGDPVDPEQGYHIVIIDAEHGAEFTTYPLLFLLPMHFGSPKYIEYAMRTMRNLIEPDVNTRWTDITSWSGWRHWRAYHHGANGFNPPPYDITENMKVAIPGFSLLDYNGDPDLASAWYELGRAWAEAGMRTDYGKPAGIIPPRVRFTDGRIGDGVNWYASPGPNGGGVGIWYFDQYYQMLVAARGFPTGAPERIALLEPIAAAVAWLFDHPSPTVTPGSPPPTGSDDWIAWKTHGAIARIAYLAREELLAEPTLAVVPTELEWVIDNEGPAYLAYLNDGNATKPKGGIEDTFESNSIWLRHFWPLATKTVLYTDRIKFGAASGLHGLYATQSGSTFNVAPTFPVSWFNPAPAQGELDLAVLVHDVDAGAGPGDVAVTALVFNFGSAPVDIGLRLWREAPLGTYTLRHGEDTDWDDVIDAGASVWSVGGASLTQRGASVVFEDVPPGVLQVLELEVETLAGSTNTSLADLALGPDDIRVNASGFIEVEVHNIGSLDYDATVDGASILRIFDDTTGAGLGGALLPSPLPAPSGLNPSSVIVTTNVVPTPGQVLRAGVSWAPQFQEITRDNNEATAQF